MTRGELRSAAGRNDRDRSLWPASRREPPEMARRANFVPDPIFLMVLVPSLNYESR
jgi:hypothetical protein